MTLARSFAALLSATFLLFAALQWNDPDAFLWMAFYTTASAVSLAFMFGRPTWLAAPLLLVAAVWFASMRDALGAGWYSSEEGREAAGLLLVACSALWLVVWRAIRGTEAGG